MPNSNIDLLAVRNRLLVRKDLHPALQYLLLEAMREVHWAPGPFNTLGEFPAEQPSDLPLLRRRRLLPLWPESLAEVHVLLAWLSDQSSCILWDSGLPHPHSYSRLCAFPSQMALYAS